MGGIQLVVATLEPANHLAADRVSVSAVFRSPGDLTTTAEIADMSMDRLERFFNVGHGGQGAVSSFISSAIDRTAGASTMSAYDVQNSLSGTLPLGSPVATRTWTLGAVGASGNDLPHEVCMVCSFHADTTNALEESGITRPAARRRGRMFVGPLHNAIGVGTDSMPRPLPALVSSLVEASRFLASPDPAEPLDDAILQVWSRTDAQVRDVVGGHVDNEFDTQRRRGMEATARTVWTV